MRMMFVLFNFIHFITIVVGENTIINSNSSKSNQFVRYLFLLNINS